IAFGARPAVTGRPRPMYFGSQRVLRSLDRGQTWTAISDDLSRRGVDAVPSSGGQMIHDLAEEEAFGVVYTIALSPVQPGVRWVGTDDGLIHLTRDEGRTWQNTTPRELTPWSKVSMIEASPHDAGTAYAAVDRHRLDDYTAHVYRTDDFGATWTETV